MKKAKAYDDKNWDPDLVDRNIEHQIRWKPSVNSVLSEVCISTSRETRERATHR